MLGAAGVVRILLRELGEIAARLHLFQNIFGLRAGVSDALFIFFATRCRKRRLDQNVADFDLFGCAVLFAMLIVIGLQILVADGCRGRQFGAIDDNVFDLPLFRNGVVIGRLVAVVESLEFLVGGMQFFENVGARDHGIVKLYFGVAAIEFRSNFSVTNESAAGDQGAQLVDDDVVLL